mgnify:CR=1 FL=1
MKLGIVGWRGMVGAVLLKRMIEENDFTSFDTTFFSTSQKGELGPKIPTQEELPLKDAYSIPDLLAQEIILTSQGSEYTKKLHGELRSKGWDGYWIDASSALRQEPSSVLVLDPFNGTQIRSSLKNGRKDFIGANCTVSLMLMAIGFI